MDGSDGLVCAYHLDGQGGGREITWADVEAWPSGLSGLWVHLDRKSERAAHWLRGSAGLDPLVCEALLAEETRPRVAALGKGVVLILRGVNLNPGADPEDMVSCRIWVEADRVITLRHPRIMAVQDIRDGLATGKGPRTPVDFIVELSGHLIDRVGPVIDGLEDGIDDIEETILDLPSRELRGKLADLRRQAIGLRRYLAPQRDVMARLATDPNALFDERHRLRLREVGDRLLRHVEDLDAARERSAVTHEEIVGRISEQMNSTMYVLSLVAAIFLPLGLITGLLGINVGGIPGAETPWAFAFVCALLVCLAGLQFWLFRRKRWI